MRKDRTIKSSYSNIIFDYILCCDCINNYENECFINVFCTHK